jgi:hypothetical protein
LSCFHLVFFPCLLFFYSPFLIHFPHFHSYSLCSFSLSPWFFLHLSSSVLHSLFLLFYAHSVFPLIPFLSFFFFFLFITAFIHSFLYMFLSGFLLYQFILSFFPVSPFQSSFLSFACFYLLVFFFISSFRLSFLIHFFQFLLLISSIQWCYFSFLSNFLSCFLLSSPYWYLLSIFYFPS